MLLKEIMARDVKSIRPDAPLSEAIEKLRQLDGEPLPVYEDQRLVGMVTEHAIVEWNSRGGRDSGTASVRDVMEKDIIYCFEDQDVEDAARIVRDRHGQGVVVMKRDGAQAQTQQPVGTISLADLATRSTRFQETVEHRPQQIVEPTADYRRIPQPRVVLQPIAAPSILGLFGLAGATFMVGAQWANWFTGSQALLFPFVAIFGGLAQFLAGMWAFRARDHIATAVHGTWGSFWMGYGLLQLLFVTGTLATPAPLFDEMGFWFIVLVAITVSTLAASLNKNIAVSALLGVLTIASGLAAYANIANNAEALRYAGYAFIISAVIGWYAGTSFLLGNTFRRSVLPLGRLRAMEGEVREEGREPYIFDYREPGVKMGQ